jgi:hypothetical protein
VESDAALSGVFDKEERFCVLLISTDGDLPREAALPAKGDAGVPVPPSGELPDIERRESVEIVLLLPWENLKEGSLGNVSNGPSCMVWFVFEIVIISF